MGSLAVNQGFGTQQKNVHPKRPQLKPIDPFRSSKLPNHPCIQATLFPKVGKYTIHVSTGQKFVGVAFYQTFVP